MRVERFLDIALCEIDKDKGQSCEEGACRLK
jgi:hypothetical protein